MRNCPRCGSQTKKVGKTLICNCGWSFSRIKEHSQKSIIMNMFLIFFLVAGGLFHFFQWGSHGFSVFFANSNKKLEICMDLKKYDCVENNYSKLFSATGDTNYLEKLGEFQFKREKFDEAQETYRLYFSKGGNAYKAAYYYAHSLAKNGDVDAAIEYFDSILRSKPNVLMVTVMESYLGILVSNNRVDKAKELLSWANKSNKGTTNTQTQIDTWKKKFNI